MTIPKRSPGKLIRGHNCYYFRGNLFPYPRWINEYENNVISLNEGLQISYPIENIAYYLCTKYRFIFGEDFENKLNSSYVKLFNSEYSGIVDIVKAANNQSFLVITVLFNAIDTAKNILKEKLQLIGYEFIREEDLPENQNDSTLRWKILFYEKKYNERYKPDFNKIHYLYHITTEDNYINSIQYRGLRTKTIKNNSFEQVKQRIYFKIYPYTDYDFKTFSETFAKRSLKDEDKSFTKKYVLLKISSEKLNNDIFYYDPRMDYAIYTFENIPAEFIQCINTCTVVYNADTRQFTVK